MNDGAAVVAREPGWWLAGTNAGIVTVFAGLLAYLARRKGYSGWRFGLCEFVAPPLSFMLATTAWRKTAFGAYFR